MMLFVSLLVLEQISTLVDLFEVLCLSLVFLLLLHHVDGALMLQKLDELIVAFRSLFHGVEALISLFPKTTDPDESDQANHTGDATSS